MFKMFSTSTIISCHLPEVMFDFRLEESFDFGAGSVSEFDMEFSVTKFYR